MTKIKDGIFEREDGKILKGPHYEEADIEKVLARATSDQSVDEAT